MKTLNISLRLSILALIVVGFTFISLSVFFIDISFAQARYQSCNEHTTKISISTFYGCRVDRRNSVTLDKHDLCRKIINNNQNKDFFIPIKTKKELESFLQNTPQGINLDDCAFYLVNNVHTNIDCMDARGEVVDVPEGKICKFPGSSCPSGWTQYKNWSTTISTTPNILSCDIIVEQLIAEDSRVGNHCRNDVCDFLARDPPGLRCTTGMHSFSNTPPESCMSAGEISARTLANGVCDISLPIDSFGAIYAVITEIGCY